MEYQRRTNSSDLITRAYLDSLLVEMRHLDAVIPSTELQLFGKTFATPVMTGALSHLNKSWPDGMTEWARGAAQAGAVAWSGMGPREELERMVDTGASVIKIIKTYADRESIYDKIRHAESCGALAVGLDIDHAFNRRLGYDEIDGMAMYPLSQAELTDMVRSTKLPFVIKGVLSRQDARKCVEAGVKGMVVSHHNGRLECAVPPLMILPEILEEAAGQAEVFVDCSLESGMDVFKALALGASAVSVGRPLLHRLKEKGAEGVKEEIERITADLRYSMAMTCSHDIRSIDRSVVRMGSFVW
ncbi:MAG: alpha-hydroxy-acid oxidizing protein [Clostridia bacterium]|nr:alpha-hydroxy-acid oxidizing protein [Clostridia bacterium]